MKVDALLVVLFFVSVAVLAESIYMRSDFMIEYGIPGVLILVVLVVFLNYVFKIISIQRKNKEN